MLSGEVELKANNRCAVSSIIRINADTLIYLCSYSEKIKLVAYNFKLHQQYAELVLPRPDLDMSYMEKLEMTHGDDQFNLYFPVPGYSRTLSSCFARARDTDYDGYKVMTYLFEGAGFRALASQNTTLAASLSAIDMKKAVREEQAILQEVDKIIKKYAIKDRMGKESITNCRNIVQTEDLYILSLYGDDKIYFLNKADTTFVTLDASSDHQQEKNRESHRRYSRT